MEVAHSLTIVWFVSVGVRRGECGCVVSECGCVVSECGWIIEMR